MQPDALDDSTGAHEPYGVWGGDGCDEATGGGGSFLAADSGPGWRSKGITRLATPHISGANLLFLKNL
jgi:hypothetical protein